MDKATTTSTTLPATLGLPGEWCLLAFKGMAWYIHAMTLETVMVGSGGGLLGDDKIPGEICDLAAREGCYFPGPAGFPYRKTFFGTSQRWASPTPTSVIAPRLAVRAMEAHLAQRGEDREENLLIALAAVAGWDYPHGHNPEAGVWQSPNSGFDPLRGFYPPPLSYGGMVHYWA